MAFDPANWLASLLGVVNFQVAGVAQQLRKRQTLNLIGATVADDPENDRTNIVIGTGVPPVPPSGTYDLRATNGVLSWVPVVVAPVLTAITPDLGDIYGGAYIAASVTGTVTSLKINGVACTNVVQVGGIVTARTPALSAGNYDVQVEGPGGTSNTLSASFEAWNPVLVYAAGRVFQSDQSVTSATLTTRPRVTKLKDEILAGVIRRDGATILRLSTGRLVMLGGWSGTLQATWPDALGASSYITNEVLYSDDNGKTWAVLLAHAGDPPTAGAGARFKPGHSAGVCVHTVGGVEYVYWIGSDANAGLARDGGVWRAPAADLSGSPSLAANAFSRISTLAPTSGKSLFMCASFQGKLWIYGGQTDLTDNSTVLQTVYWSADGIGAWTQIANAPWSGRGAIYGDPVHDGKLWVIGGCRYDVNVPGNRIFYNGVWYFDGAAWTQVLADGHGQFGARNYHAINSVKGRLVVTDGYNTTGGNKAELISSANNGANWTVFAQTWTATHAHSTVVIGNKLLKSGGEPSAGLWLIEEHTGNLVSAWGDLGTGALSLAQGTNANKPILDPTALGGMPGVVLTGAEVLMLAAKDASLGVGGVFECFIVAKTFDCRSAPIADPTIDPPNPLIDHGTSAKYNGLGMKAGELVYKEGASSWNETARGSGLNDDVARLLGASHGLSSLKMYVGDAQQGATNTGVGFHATNTGWQALGQGYNPANKGQAVVGALVVLKVNAESSADFKSKLARWAQKWAA